MKTTFFDKSGNAVPENIACDEHGYIRDGYSMRTRVLMMDSAQQMMMDEANRAFRDPHKPLTDDEKVAAIDARNAKLSDAWRHPTPGVQLAPHEISLKQDTRPVPKNIDMDAVYEARDRRLEDAWRQPATAI